MIKVRFTIAVWSDAYKIANESCNILNKYFEVYNMTNGKDYGPIDEIIFVAVSVSDDPSENDRFVEEHNTRGTLKDFSSGEKRRYVSIGVTLSPKNICNCSIESFCSIFFNSSVNVLLQNKEFFLKNVAFDELYNDFSLMEQKFHLNTGNAFKSK